MLGGMHGTESANYAITECDLLIAIGARFDDRVTGKLESFAPNAQVIHIDIDLLRLGKIRLWTFRLWEMSGMSLKRSTKS